MAWVGMALARLYAATSSTAYLSGAESIGASVVRELLRPTRRRGIHGWETSNGARIRWKSTEQNIDLFSLFTMLRTETGNSQWTSDAARARTFVDAMWNRSTGSFSVGTTTNGVSVNTTEQPEDVNSWSYLALQDPAFNSSIDWNVHHLSVSAGGFSGVSFCLGDKSGVWFKGTAHVADALEIRHGNGDGQTSKPLLRRPIRSDERSQWRRARDHCCIKGQTTVTGITTIRPFTPARRPGTSLRPRR